MTVRDKPVVYKDRDGYLVFREGSNERNDDWIKVVTKTEGNTADEEAYQEIKRKLDNGENLTNPEV